MFKRIEHILVVAFTIHVSFLVLSSIHLAVADPLLFERSILPLYLVIFFCLIMELFFQKMNYFLIFSTIHFLSLLIIFKNVGFDILLIKIFLFFFLFFNIALRLSLLQSVILNIFFFAISCYSIFDHGKSNIFLFFYYFLIEAVLVSFSHLISYYRESLINSRDENEENLQATNKLEAASESFLKHMTEIREESAEEERYRITRELHDSLGYSMTNIAMIMNAAQYLLEDDPERVKSYCIKTRDIAEATMEETRRTLYQLREITWDLHKKPALFFDKMCRDFQEATGIETQCLSGNLPNVLPERIFATLYRIVQVGFINALKHGETKTIRLHFWIVDYELRMTIWNNANKLVNSVFMEEGIGLQGVRERLILLEGKMHIHQTITGFSLNITIPLPND